VAPVFKGEREGVGKAELAVTSTLGGGESEIVGVVL